MSRGAGVSARPPAGGRGHHSGQLNVIVSPNGVAFQRPTSCRARLWSRSARALFARSGIVSLSICSYAFTSASVRISVCRRPAASSASATSAPSIPPPSSRPPRATGPHTPPESPTSSSSARSGLPRRIDLAGQAETGGIRAGPVPGRLAPADEVVLQAQGDLADVVLPGGGSHLDQAQHISSRARRRRVGVAPQGAEV